MKTLFSLPKTRWCKVIYVRDGVQYEARMQTPVSNDALQMAMLARKVGLSQIVRIVGV